MEHVAAPRGTLQRRVQDAWTPVHRLMFDGCHCNRQGVARHGRAACGCVVRVRVHLPGVSLSLCVCGGGGRGVAQKGGHEWRLGGSGKALAACRRAARCHASSQGRAASALRTLPISLPRCQPMLPSKQASKQQLSGAVGWRPPASPPWIASCTTQGDVARGRGCRLQRRSDRALQISDAHVGHRAAHHGLGHQVRIYAGGHSFGANRGLARFQVRQ